MRLLCGCLRVNKQRGIVTRPQTESQQNKTIPQSTLRGGSRNAKGTDRFEKARNSITPS